ncbi:MAG: RidA family protein [Alphaproteobacteria bacterium]|jgi:enamine deaminase RidA (YjgF/YER057c/UK114 family)
MARFEDCLYADEALERKLGFPRFVKANGMLYMSGMLSADENFDLVGADDMEAQVERIYTRLETALATQGATLQHVVSEILFTTDLDALSAAAHVRRARYDKHGASIPASTAVQVAALALPGAMLEIHPTVVAP